MKKLLFTLLVLFSVDAYANSGIDTAKQIVALVESGNIFNLTKTAESLKLKDEIYRAEHKSMAHNNHIRYTYPIHNHQVIKSISYRASFGGRDLSEVRKSVDIAFKSEHCPSIDELQTTFGKSLIKSEWGSPLSLQTIQGVHFTEYDILTKNQMISVNKDGCEFSVMMVVKLE